MNTENDRVPAQSWKNQPEENAAVSRVHRDGQLVEVGGTVHRHPVRAERIRLRLQSPAGVIVASSVATGRCWR